MVPRYFYAESADVFPGVIARSKAAQDYETFLHRTIYPRVIHPNSRFRVYWDIAQLVFTFVELITFWFFWVYIDHDAFLYHLILNLMLATHFTDCVLMFFTGYVEEGTGIAVLNMRKIAKRYLLRTFILDLLASVPVELFMYFYKRECVAISVWHFTKPCCFVVYASLVQVFLRVGSALRYLKNTSRVMFWNPFLLSLFFILYFLLVIFNLQLCTSFLLTYAYDLDFEAEKWEQLPSAILSFLFTFVHGEVMIVGWYGLVRIPTLILTFFFTVYFTAYLIKYTRFAMKTTERFYTLESDVRIFARKSRLPVSLKQKTLLYFKVFIRSKHYRQDKMFTYFPESFKADIFVHLSLPLLKGFYAFEEFPIYVLRRLAENLRYQLHLPNEMVMMRGEKKLSMYFVQTGTVALYTGNNTELYHFEDGCCFNEKHFLDGKLSTEHYAISIEVTEIYRLDRDDFLDIMSAYPKLLEKMKETFYRDIIDEHILPKI